jgi:hypothetical protein
MCVSWTLSYSIVFQSDCPHLQSLYPICASALCSWVPLWGTWEDKVLVWVGYKFWRWGSKLPCRAYYSKFLNFFPVWGEHSVNHGWLCAGEDVCQVCGYRPLLHQRFSATVDSTESVRTGDYSFNKATKRISSTTLFLPSLLTYYSIVTCQ